MSEPLPPIQYTQAGDVDIAYRVVGDGPIDLVWVPGLISNLEIEWEDHVKGGLYRRLASFTRLITFDKRGMGLSDRSVGAPTLEERMDDVRAVMDAVGSERAAILGNSEGGFMSQLFAATHPERTTALILFGTGPRPTPAPGYDVRSAMAGVRRAVEDGWGTGSSAEMFASSMKDHPLLRETLGRIERAAGSPRTILAIVDAVEGADVRSAAPMISAPTLVIHCRDDKVIDQRASQWLADHIEGARYVEIDGEHVVYDTDHLVEEIESFLTGERTATVPERVLSTVMFSDIVASTETAAAVGDRQWRDLLDQHDRLAEREIAQAGGRLIKSTGDGVLATFDGPARGVTCGRRLHEAMAAIGIDLRVGLHTGEIELRGDDIGGLGVHIGARVSGLADTGEVLVSRTVTDLVAGSGLEFEDRGEHELKGVPGSWQLFALRA